MRALTPIAIVVERNSDEEPSVEKRQFDLGCRLRPGRSLQGFAAHDAIRFKGFSGYATHRIRKAGNTPEAPDGGRDGSYRLVGLPVCFRPNGI